MDFLQRLLGRERWRLRAGRRRNSSWKLDVLIEHRHGARIQDVIKQGELDKVSLEGREIVTARAQEKIFGVRRGEVDLSGEFRFSIAVQVGDDTSSIADQ